MQADIKFYVKRGTKFFEVFKSPSIDWCKVVEGKSRAMNFQKLLLKSIQTSAPALIHPCPYEGKYSVLNISSPKDVVEIIPVGSFKLHIRVSDKIDKNFANFNLSFEVFKV